MEAKIQNQIIDFFSFLEDFYDTSKTCLNSCQSNAVSINKIIRRCTNIKEAQLKETPLEEFVGLQKKLLSRLHNFINIEIQEIQNQYSILEENFDKLCHKSKILHESCRTIDFNQTSPLVRGTPLQPSLKQILLFATESVTFGGQVTAQVETSLSVLSFKQLQTAHFVDHFKFPKPWNKRIPEILAYTSFCQDNVI
ncbi:unnamed protein product [Pieris brassicae]|uniref:Uncharacterized protein n=1 Tax=Pieris brassicae TaxID=7116 RepID=A0A9P0TQA5_PIEBR|nr:unnamed protein product [Pieris brassicae]